MASINEIKDKIQNQALRTHQKSNGFSTLAMCTGSGKSRCGVLRAQEIVAEKPNAKILLGCFTTDQRDRVWKDEFKEWGAEHIYNNNVIERVCYKSLPTITDEEWDLCIFDECHHLTESSLLFFETNKIHSILALTATPPTDKIKKAILNTIAPISFIYPVEQGIKDGVVAPYELHVIYTKLEERVKTVDGGSKAKPFKQTEKSAYEYWDNACTSRFEEYKTFVSEKLWPLGWSNEAKYRNEEKCKENAVQIEKHLKRERALNAKYMMAISKRSSIIYNSFNKTRILKRLISEFCTDDNRYLFFGGSIKQCEEVLPGQTYHSETNSDAYQKFLDEKINKLIAVKGLNEGANIKNLDFGVVGQLNSKELDIIQRIGRVIRIRPNHVGKIIILCVEFTRDKEWLKSALKNMKFIPIKEYTEQEFFESIKQTELF